jgi:hypothetical protein
MAVSQLQEFIEQSELSDKDKDMWWHMMDVIDDDHAQAILESLGDNPLELEVLTRNLKLKQIAFKSGDPELFEQIIQEELAALRDL